MPKDNEGHNSKMDDLLISLARILCILFSAAAGGDDPHSELTLRN